MAKNTRKNTRKASRKSRKSGQSMRIFQRVWSPFNHLLRATGESAHRVGSTAGRIVKETTGLPANVGRSFAKHGNAAIHNIFRGKTRGSRR